MDERVIDLLNRIVVVLEQQNEIPIWEIIINIIPWLGVIISLTFLFVERYEKRRPYLEVSFELVRSTLACVVIRNVGNAPARLTSMLFNEKFIQQLDKEKISSLNKKREMDVKIFPGRHWVLYLGKNIFDVIKFQDTILRVDYKYCKFRGKRKYEDRTEIDFKEYGSFLLYLSEIDELKTMTEKKLTEITELCDDIKQCINESTRKN